MTEQLELGQAAADQGMARANAANRVQTWKQYADSWLIGVIQAGRKFTADDLINDVGLPDHGVGKNNVVGAWINAQSKRGLIEFTGQFRKSKRIDRHTGIQRVWKVK